MRYLLFSICTAATVSLAMGCSGRASETGDGAPPPAGDQAIACACTGLAGDADKDGIPDSVECKGCMDSDWDKIPDYMDLDSDNDGIPDSIEKGDRDGQGACKGKKAPKNAWPCDTDGDGHPDYLDVDSDGDGLLDEDEDANGDGLLGCCLQTCNAPGGKQKGRCKLTVDGCGSNQACAAGTCLPPVDRGCADGETDPRKKDTFGDGCLDSARCSFICRNATADNPAGRKPVQLFTSVQGDWRLALDMRAAYKALSLPGAGAKEAAGVIDFDIKNKSGAAGFVVSMPTADRVEQATANVVKALGASPPGGAGVVSMQASGATIKTHDMFDAVVGTTLEIKLTSPGNASTARNSVIGAILGRPAGQLGTLPAPHAKAHTSLVVRFVTVKRFAHKKDSAGNLLDEDGKRASITGKPPVDSGDKSKWRLVIVGAVAGKDTYEDPKLPARFDVDDLSGGTALARAAGAVFDECDVVTISSLPKADIIWVIDESGSMSDNRTDIVNNANILYSRALSSGLDFRMGVTNVCSPTGSYKAAVGKFCSEVSTSTSSMGGKDRFLLPAEQSIFSACIKNPPGYEGGNEFGLVNAVQAVKKHLPRAAGDPTKIRPGAKVVIIVVTDEYPASVSSMFGCCPGCQLDAATQTQLDAKLQPTLDLFQGITDPEAAAVLHVIGGACNNACGAQVAFGYRDLAQKLGGQLGDVCQKNLGATLQVIVDDIVGQASPVRLEYVPISSSLAITLDGVEIKRSRTSGFGYRAVSNSLALVNVKYKKGSELIAAYVRWKQ